MVDLSNRQAICEVLLEAAADDHDIVVLCSDSRGSASLDAFADAFPAQFVECGIAEQSMVSMAAGLARCGKKAVVAAPACFLTTRAMEQCKVDVAYSNTNVKLIGISGGVSYGALGSTHHSTQDIATMGSIPNMRVYMPCDSTQTRALMRALLQDNKPAYIRVGRNPVDRVYDEESAALELNCAKLLGKGGDLLIVACGECVLHTKRAMDELVDAGIGAAVLDMVCIKPMDDEALLRHAAQAKAVLTVEEHVRFGGLGSQVARVLAEHCPRPMRCLALSDEPVVAGTSRDVFAQVGLDTRGIVCSAVALMQGD